MLITLEHVSSDLSLAATEINEIYQNMGWKFADGSEPDAGYILDVLSKTLKKAREDGEARTDRIVIRGHNPYDEAMDNFVTFEVLIYV
jgi:hypothetical protein